MNNILDIMNDINTNELDNFFSNTNAKFKSVSDIKETKVDHSWLNVLEDTLPNLDKIIRNPRRFLVQEEDVVIVEKIKKIGQQTIKHLAEHSENIQDLDKNGDVIPKKLLNVYKEDTIDLYENRFIYTLVKRLNDFIARQLDSLDIVLSKEKISNVDYKASTILKNKKINIELKLNKVEIYDYSDDESTLKDRILNCYEVINSFNSCEMIKEVIGCTPVSNPIRKTNLILKDPNFQKAYILWQYLDNFEYKDPKITNYSQTIDSSDQTKDEFTLSYFINCNAIDEKKENLMKYKDIDSKLNKLIDEYIYENNNDIELFINKTKELYTNALKEKNKRIDEISSIFNDFINLHNNNLKNIESVE